MALLRARVQRIKDDIKRYEEEKAREKKENREERIGRGRDK